MATGRIDAEWFHGKEIFRVGKAVSDASRRRVRLSSDNELNRTTVRYVEGIGQSSG
jgi:hypothetical protein